MLGSTNEVFGCSFSPPQNSKPEPNFEGCIWYTSREVSTWPGDWCHWLKSMHVIATL